MRRRYAFMFALFLLFSPAFSSLAGARAIRDGMGRTVEIPDAVERVLCSGSGCLRLLVYLNAQDRAVGVDSAEKRTGPLASLHSSKPYLAAHPELSGLPLFGEFRGMDNPELILGLSPQPQVIFKVFAPSAVQPDELQAKTGIPVVAFEYGNLSNQKETFFAALRLMADVLGVKERGESVVAFFEEQMKGIRSRTAGVAPEKRRRCYVGGVAYKGPHGITSTEPGYPPFALVGAENVASVPAGKGMGTATIAKEKLLEWDPAVFFIDLSTTTGGKEANALIELGTDSSLATIAAVRNGEIYGVLPYNSYSINFGSILADAWFVGKILYPELFADVDPVKKADEIYSFLVGKPVFPMVNSGYGNQVFTKLSPQKD